MPSHFHSISLLEGVKSNARTRCAMAIPMHPALVVLKGTSDDQLTNLGDCELISSTKPHSVAERKIYGNNSHASPRARRERHPADKA